MRSRILWHHASSAPHPEAIVPITPTTARGRATRQALLTAAEEVFGESNYARASVTEITRRAGVSQGTFYVYFSSKTEIFEELVRHLGRSLRRSLAQATACAPTRLAIEEAGLRAFLAFVGEHRDLYRIVRQAEFVSEDVFREYYRSLAEGYREGLRASVDAGEVADVDLEALSYALMGIYDFVGMRWVLWEQDGVPEAVIRSIVHLLAHGLPPDGAPDP